MNSTLKIVLIALAGVLVIIIAIVIYRIVTTNRTKTINLLRDGLGNEVNLRSLSSTIAPVTTAKEIAPLSLSGVEWSYSMWVKLGDVSAASLRPQRLLFRSSTTASTTDQPAAPSIFIVNGNMLQVRISTVSGTGDGNLDTNVYPDYESTTLSTTSSSAGASQQYTNVNPLASTRSQPYTPLQAINVANLPLQRWNHVVVTLWNRTCDVYVNGKLIRSVILPGVPLKDSDALSTITLGTPDASEETLTGFLARVLYYNRAISAKEVANLYRKGPMNEAVWWTAFKKQIALSLKINNE